MAEIESRVDRERDVTVRTVRGSVVVTDILAAIAAIGPPTKHTIWDFSAADVDALSRADLQVIARSALPALAQRAGGRIALILASPSAYGMARMYSHILDAKDGVVTHEPFYDIESAMAWLAEE